MKKLLALLSLLTFTVFANGERIVYSAQGGRVKTLDPAQADDSASSAMVNAFYDTLLQYDYTGRPYRLKPSMLARNPVFSADYRSCRFTLRSDLYFADAPPFAGQTKEARRITAEDVRYSLLRFADARRFSPLYWMFRGKIIGLDAFRKATESALPGDMSPYDMPFPGFEKHSDWEFSFHFTKPDPRFCYLWAMPNSGIVSRQAELFYEGRISRHPVGSGPFLLKEWIPDYKMVLVRNPDYRSEFFPEAETPDDRKRPLPLADRIVVYTIKQPMSAWLLFLQGKLDFNAVDKDNLDLISDGAATLSPAMKKRGIHLTRVPEFEVRFIGFNFGDPLLKNNLKLRRALSLAYNVQRRIEHVSGQLLRAHTPIPPGVAGHEENFRNPWSADDLELAKKLLAEAGFPEGIDPATGKPLKLTFDQAGNSSAHRQIAEITAAEWKALGIEAETILNNKPRFFERMRRGKTQLFRISWIGDYPDAENFLQLFYSGNIGGCNRTGYSDPAFDREYEALLTMADSPERTKRYEKLARKVTADCPWILEGFPVSFQLRHDWLENYLPHDFAFGRWKYLTVDPEKRRKLRSTFKPLTLSELRN